MTSFWARRSVRVFLLVGFGIPWIGWSTIALTGMAPSALRTALFYTGDFMTVGGLVATWVAGGSTALRHLGQRCLRGGRAGWWLFALFLPLLWQLAARVGYGLAHEGTGPFMIQGLVQFIAPGSLLAFTTGPLGEEAGWRGFFLPRLIDRFGASTGTLILGVMWAFWHYPLYVKTVFATGQSAVTFVISVLAFSVLLTVLFHRTRGSLLLAVLFHWAVNVSPGVADAMFPQLGMPDGVNRVVELAALLVVTAIVVLVFGWKKMGSGDDFVPATDLAAESIRSDQPRPIAS